MNVSTLLYLGGILIIVGNNFSFVNKINLEPFEIMLLLNILEFLSKLKKIYIKFQ